MVGDTVSDPFKNTSGPAMNILIKLMSVVPLAIAPALPMNGLFFVPCKWDCGQNGQNFFSRESLFGHKI